MDNTYSQQSDTSQPAFLTQSVTSSQAAASPLSISQPAFSLSIASESAALQSALSRRGSRGKHHPRESPSNTGLRPSLDPSSDPAPADNDSTPSLQPSSSEPANHLPPAPPQPGPRERRVSKRSYRQRAPRSEVVFRPVLVPSRLGLSRLTSSNPVLAKCAFPPSQRPASSEPAPIQLAPFQPILHPTLNLPRVHFPPLNGEPLTLEPDDTETFTKTNHLASSEYQYSLEAAGNDVQEPAETPLLDKWSSLSSDVTSSQHPSDDYNSGINHLHSSEFTYDSEAGGNDIQHCTLSNPPQSTPWGICPTLAADIQDSSHLPPLSPAFAEDGIAYLNSLGASKSSRYLPLPLPSKFGTYQAPIPLNPQVIIQDSLVHPMTNLPTFQPPPLYSSADPFCRRKAGHVPPNIHDIMTIVITKRVSFGKSFEDIAAFLGKVGYGNWRVPTLVVDLKRYMQKKGFSEDEMSFVMMAREFFDIEAARDTWKIDDMRVKCYDKPL